MTLALEWTVRFGISAAVVVLCVVLRLLVVLSLGFWEKSVFWPTAAEIESSRDQIKASFFRPQHSASPNSVEVLLTPKVISRRKTFFSLARFVGKPQD